MKTIEELEAELETVTRERDKLSVLVELSDGYRRERDEARAELTRERIGIRPVDEVRSDAYRRGAEAMREACANAMHPIMRSMISRTEAAQTIRALPIPEEP
jgi:hypothetical protein